MPDTPPFASLTLTTRGDELDRTGAVSAGQLLRYLEAGRWQASLDADNALAPLILGGQKVVVRAQRLRLGVSAGWGEVLQAQTWLARVGRTSVDIGHALMREGDGARVCEALLTLVQIDATGQPTPLAGRVELQPGAPALDPQLLELVCAGELPPDAWTRAETILPSQTDLFRHVNHSRYVDLFEDARWFMERARGIAGWQPKRRLAQIALEYRREAKAGDEVAVRMHARDPETLDAQLVRGDEVLTRCVLQVRD